MIVRTHPSLMLHQPSSSRLRAFAGHSPNDHPVLCHNCRYKHRTARFVLHPHIIHAMDNNNNNNITACVVSPAHSNCMSTRRRLCDNHKRCALSTLGHAPDRTKVEWYVHAIREGFEMECKLPSGMRSEHLVNVAHKTFIIRMDPHAKVMVVVVAGDSHRRRGGGLYST